MITPTFRELQKCCEREAGKRRHVYPRLVAGDRMTQDKADHEIAMMVAAGEYFKALADSKDAEGRLL
jgi:hypothetical protein